MSSLLRPQRSTEDGINGWASQISSVYKQPSLLDFPATEDRFFEDMHAKKAMSIKKTY